MLSKIVFGIIYLLTYKQKTKNSAFFIILYNNIQSIARSLGGCRFDFVHWKENAMTNALARSAKCSKELLA